MSRTAEAESERRLHLKDLRRLKKSRGECAWAGSTPTIDAEIHDHNSRVASAVNRSLTGQSVTPKEYFALKERKRRLQKHFEDGDALFIADADFQ
jgi:hypothetical protein